MNLIDEIEREQIAAFEAEKSIPDFQPGDTVKVNVKVIEGSRERVQAFEGVCIARSGKETPTAAADTIPPAAQEDTGVSADA